MLQRLDLIDDRFVDLRICMTDADGEHTAKTVEILVVLVIPNMKAFAAHECERLLVVGSDGREQKFFMFANGFGHSGSLFGCIHCLSSPSDYPFNLLMIDFARSSLIPL